MAYVKEFGGYVADVPKLWFRRCDNRIFNLDELTAANMTVNQNPLEINAGWNLFPVAVLDGQSTLELAITSGKFEAELFTMTNNTNFAANNAFEMFATETLTPDDNHQVRLMYEAVPGSIYINGLQETAAATPAEGTDPADVESGKFTAETDEGVTVITFSAEDIDTTVKISYTYLTDAQEAKIDNHGFAIGEAVAIYPVYNDGTDCSNSNIIGYVILKIFKARITQQPGLSGSYKTASTYDFTISALDAKRPDGANYSIAYVRV